ncbi:hypothetical protein GMDG_07856 [Pseudogymnoascus destructans 20631-21]|uniref:Uncharacterized protein n=1 Tax=Pseudogymnoascus destructans (strain ATCC MYA-4855 / 20631-21) TaxID=658429 RepID=L8G2K9_PSED2|nr:hypothetical protein GMDG_07856 [Pseudogymnoascus destructans 20631-21]
MAPHLTPPALIPRSMNELKALMAFGPSHDRVSRRQWQSMGRTAIWSLWKAYLSHSFEKPVFLWTEHRARAAYRAMIFQRILSERGLSTKELYRNAAHNEGSFERTWNENPRSIRILHGPQCLQDLPPLLSEEPTQLPPNSTDLLAPTQTHVEGQWDTPTNSP